MGCGTWLRRRYWRHALADATYQNTPKFQLPLHWAKVVKVYDGDTCHLAFRQAGSVWRHPLRLLGYDCAEMRAKEEPERQLARQSTIKLEQLLLGRVVELRPPLNWDKYGRLLADLRLPGTPSVCAWMLEHGGAVPYDGGTKQRWPCSK